MPELHTYREDLSRLSVARPAVRLAMVFEPLDDLIVDDWLVPYCWGASRVSFFPHYDRSMLHKLAETGHRWRGGDRVDATFEGSPPDGYELLSARCVYRQGQWCMQWLARRVRDGAGPVEETGETTP